MENEEEIEKMLNINIEIGSDVRLVKDRLCESSCRLKVKKVKQFQKVSTYETLFMGPEIELESICEPTESDSKFTDKQSFNVKLVQLPGECYNVLDGIKDFESMDMSFDLISDSPQIVIQYLKL